MSATNDRMICFAPVVGLALAVVACGPAPSAVPAASTSEASEPATTAIVWPAGFVVMGDGFPKPGDPCRRLGESALTVDYLDDSAILVGCAGADSEAAAAAVAQTMGGQRLASVNGVALVTIPLGDANVGLPAAAEIATESKGSDTQ